MANPVVWFELGGPNPDATADFYTELFRWHAEAIPGAEYTAFDTHAGSGINGGLTKTEGTQEPGVTFYVGADDPQALLDKAVSLGATVLVPVTAHPMVTFALFSDPQGAILGIVKNREADDATGPSDGDGIAVDWIEIQLPEPVKGWDFYSKLFGWKIEGDPAGEFVHGQIMATQGASGGIGSSPDGKPHVTIYAGVDDLHKYLEVAETLGGGIVMPPMEVGEGTEIAQLRDPQGTWFGLWRRGH
jgi:predicted enzyme related to lactoylglutathione lyase